jgi:hypothetical protein
MSGHRHVGAAQTWDYAPRIMVGSSAMGHPPAWIVMVHRCECGLVYRPDRRRWTRAYPKAAA